MKKEELANKLDSIQLSSGLYDEATRLVDENDLVVVLGASDDLIEFRGAIEDEGGCYNGGVIHINDQGIVVEPECDCEHAKRWYAEQCNSGDSIEAVWCDPDSKASWSYKTDIPHSTFRVMEDGDIYCIGIVFERDSLK